MKIRPLLCSYIILNMLVSLLMPSVILASGDEVVTVDTYNDSDNTYGVIDGIVGGDSSPVGHDRHQTVKHGSNNSHRVTRHHGEHAHAHASHDKKVDSQLKRTGKKQQIQVKKTSQANSAKYGASHGGALSQVGISVGVIAANNMLAAGSVKEGAKTTLKQFKTPAFLVGTLLGGLLGAHLGAMIPLAGIVGATGILGSMLTVFPAIAGASILGRLISEAITQRKDDDFSVGSVLKSVDWVSMGMQIVGASIGCAIGSLFFPAPIIGSLVVGVLGGWLMGKIVEHFRSDSEERNSDEYDTHDSEWNVDSEKFDGEECTDEDCDYEACDVEDCDLCESEPSYLTSLKDYSVSESLVKLKEKVQAAYRKIVSCEDTSERVDALKAYNSARAELHKAMKSQVSSGN